MEGFWSKEHRLESRSGGASASQQMMRAGHPTLACETRVALLFVRFFFSHESGAPPPLLFGGEVGAQTQVEKRGRGVDRED